MRREDLGAQPVRAIDDEVVHLPTGHGDVQDDQVSVGHRVVNLPLQVGERAAQPQRARMECGWAPTPGRGRLVDTLPVAGVGMHDGLETGQRAVTHELDAADGEALGFGVDAGSGHGARF